MIILLIVVVLGFMCWGLCELISTFVGILFAIAAMYFILKMTKEIYK